MYQKQCVSNSGAVSIPKTVNTPDASPMLKHCNWYKAEAENVLSCQVWTVQI